MKKIIILRLHIYQVKSLLFFNKIESSIGVDKWVKVLDIQEKRFMKPLYKFIFLYLE